MSKYDSKIRAAGAVGVEIDDLLRALGRPLLPASDRRDAMAQYLSGEEGWRDARKALRGTFARPPATTTRLTSGEDK